MGHNPGYLCMQGRDVRSSGENVTGADNELDLLIELFRLVSSTRLVLNHRRSKVRESNSHIIIIIIIIYPLTARVVGAPHMISHPVSSIFSVLHCLWDLTNSKPVHSLMSFYLFLCLPCLLSSFTVPCKMVMARPDERET